jgi:hypothetical protein
MRRFPLPLVAALTLAAACSSSDPTGSGNPGNTTGMGATINGASWVPAGKAAAVYSNNIFALSGLNLTYSMSLAIGNLTTTGTYSLNPGNLMAADGIVSNTTGGWSSVIGSGSGSVTFTTLTAHHAVGTFAFDATPASGTATGTLHVTNGTFDVTY